MFFFFNDTATTEIYTLSLHDALPILAPTRADREDAVVRLDQLARAGDHVAVLLVRDDEQRLGQGARLRDLRLGRSEEHTSELQSRPQLVCRLLLGKKNIHDEPRSLPA